MKSVEKRMVYLTFLLSPFKMYSLLVVCVEIHCTCMVDYGFRLKSITNLWFTIGCLWFPLQYMVYDWLLMKAIEHVWFTMGFL